MILISNSCSLCQIHIVCRFCQCIHLSSLLQYVSVDSLTFSVHLPVQKINGAQEVEVLLLKWFVILLLLLLLFFVLGCEGCLIQNGGVVRAPTRNAQST